MSGRSNSSLSRGFGAFAVFASLFSLAVGLSGLAGWAFRIPSLDTWGAAGVTMVPNTAACFLLLGVSLGLLSKQDNRAFAWIKKPAAKIAAATVSLVGLLSLAEHFSSWDFGLDQLLMKAPPAEQTATARSGLMSPITAVAFLLLGLALLGIDWRTRRGRWPAQFLSLSAGGAASFGILSFAFDPHIYASHLSLALPTAVTLAVLSLGLVCARTEWGLGALLCSQSLGGSLARRLLPAAFIPVLVGWTRWHITATGLFSEWSIVVLATLITMFLLIALIAWAAVAVDRSDAERRAVEAALHLGEEQLNRLLGRFEEPQAEALLRRKVVGGFIAAALLTSFLGFLAWRTSKRAEEDADSVARTHVVLATLEATVRHVVDVETGGRGFALTGHEPFLEPYETGKRAVGQNLDALRHLTADNPNQQGRLDVLEPQVSARMELTTRMVAGRRQTGVIPTVDQLERGRQLTNAVRATVQQMESEEERLLEQRTRKTHAARRWTISIMILGSFLAVGFLVLAGFAINRQIGVSARGRAQVDTLNADLERRVQQRTAALGESEGRLAGVIQSAMDSIITLDEDQRIVLFNAAAERMFRCPAAEALGQSIDRFIPQRFHAAHAGHIRKFAETGVTNRAMGTLGALWALRAGGEEFQIEASISQIEAAGQKMFTVILRDVTARQQAEEALREQAQQIRLLNEGLEQRVRQRTAQLEASNKELESFTYSVSHDLRAPLRHISAFSKILSEEYGPQLPAEVQRYLERIQEGTRRMGLLVDDLLNLARVGRQELRRQVTGLNSVVGEVVKELQSECEGRQVEWKIGSLPFVECDPGLVRQVLQNLLSNALKYTRPRSPAVIEVGAKSDHGQSVVFVRDNGVGFSMKYADKLFGVFQRLHRPEDFEGTGVGLATVQRIIQKHGGRIWAEAELDKGATFCFTLGAAEPTPGKATDVKNKIAAAGAQL